MAEKKKRRYAAPPPPPPPADEGPAPIGVGRDYVIEDSNTFGFAEDRKPRYFSGAQNTEVAGLSAEDRAELQLTLKELGLIGPKTRIRLGVWDSTSAEAFRQVLAWANTTGTTWRSALTDMMASGVAFGDLGGDGGDAGPLPTNSLDVQALGKETARDVQGRGLTAGEQAQFEQRFRSLEAPHLAGTAGQDAPGQAGIQEFATQQIRAIDPVRADSRSAVKVASVISRMLGGQLPSTQGDL